MVVILCKGILVSNEIDARTVLEREYKAGHQGHYNYGNKENNSIIRRRG